MRILNKKQALILSNQNFSNSITSIRKIDNIGFNKLKTKEINESQSQVTPWEIASYIDV